MGAGPRTLCVYNILHNIIITNNNNDNIRQGCGRARLSSSSRAHTSFRGWPSNKKYTEKKSLFRVFRARNYHPRARSDERVIRHDDVTVPASVRWSARENVQRGARVWARDNERVWDDRAGAGENGVGRSPAADILTRAKGLGVFIFYFVLSPSRSGRKR